MIENGLPAISNCNDVFTAAHVAMDQFQSMNIKQVEFTTGLFFKDYGGGSQVLANKGIMAIRNSDEMIIRKANDNSQITNMRHLPPVTQEAYSVYKGTSQSAVSIEESKLK